MSKTLNVSKKPKLTTTLPSEKSYTGISSNELLKKVQMLHEQIADIGKYLNAFHRLAIYNYDETDAGDVLVEFPENKKGFLLDTVVKLRGLWDPTSDMLEATDTKKVGCLYIVSATRPVEQFDTLWEPGDYALYNETGTLINVTAGTRANLYRILLNDINNAMSALFDEEGLIHESLVPIVGIVYGENPTSTRVGTILIDIDD